MTRARICLVSEIFHPEDQGGQGQQAFALARRIQADGFDVHVVTRRNFAQTTRRDRLEGVDVVRLSPTGMFKGRGWAALPPTIWFLFLLFIHLLRSARSYDVILIQGVKAILLPPMLVGWMLRKPCIVKIDAHAELEEEISAESLERMKVPGLAALIRAWGRFRDSLLRRSSAIIAISGEIEAALIRKFGQQVPIVRIPNGIDLQRFTATPKSRQALRLNLGLPDAALVIYAGRISRAKGLAGLLRVWSRLASRYPNAHLVLVGGGDRSPDNCEDELREFVETHDLAERVTFTGHVNDVARYLHASDLFVLPSDSEGFGLALVEAMAAGLPCVSTAVGVAPEVIREHESGWLAPPKNEAALETALDHALAEQSRWASMGVAARQAVNQFDISSVVKLYESTIESAASNPTESYVSKSAVRTNALWLLGCRIAADLLNFVLFLIVSNRFGPSGMGVYAYGFAIAGFIYAATTLGIDEYGIREYVRREGEHRKRLVSDLLGAQCVVSAIAFAGLALYLYVTAASAEVLVIVASISVYQVCAALANTLFVPTMAEQRMMNPALIILSSRAIALVASGALMWIADTELMWALTPFALSGVFMFVLALRSAKTFGATLRPHFAMSVLQDASRKLWSFAAIDIMGQVFTRIAVIGLMLWASERATGVYAAGLKLAELACMPLLFLGQAAYPALSRCFSQPAQFRKLSRLALVWGSLIALVIAAAMALLVPVLLVPLLGEGYAGSETIIASMAVLAFVQGLEIGIGRLLLAANLSVARAQWVSLGAVLCAVGTALLVPRFGVPAAIGATVTAYVLVDALYLRSLLRTTHRESFQSGMVERPTTKVVA